MLHFLVHHLAYDAVAVLRLVSELLQARTMFSQDTVARAASN